MAAQAIPAWGAAPAALAAAGAAAEMVAGAAARIPEAAAMERSAGVEAEGPFSRT